MKEFSFSKTAQNFAQLLITYKAFTENVQRLLIHLSF